MIINPGYDNGSNSGKGDNKLVRPDSPTGNLHDFYIELGLNAERDDNLTLALNFYEQAVEERPDSACAWCNCGDVLFHLKRHEEALPFFQSAILLLPDNAGINHMLGIIVGALMLESGNWRTHIVEAKSTNSGHAVQQAIGQLKAVRKWADRLYLSIEAKSWRDFSSKDKKGIEDDIASNGLGLFLVEGKTVQQHTEAPPNSTVEPSLRMELLTQLGVNVDRPGTFWELGAKLSDREAQVACHAMVLMCDYLTCEVKEVWQERNKTRGKSSLTAEFSGGRKTKCSPYVMLRTHFWKKLGGTRYLGIEGDPFGVICRDAESVIWVWLDADSLKLPKPLKFPLELYLYAENEDGDYRCKRLQDFGEVATGEAGYYKDCWLGCKIPIFGRSSEGIKADVNRTLAMLPSLG